MTDRTLAGMGLKLEDVGGVRRIGELDQMRILSDLRDAGVPSRQRVWFEYQSLGDYDRVLLARDEGSGKYEGALVVQCRAMGDTPFLTIEALTAEHAPRTEALLRRLLAYLLLSFDSFQDRPVAVLATTRNASLSRTMRDVAARIDGAGFYPEPAGPAVSWATASLAHRMARQAGLGRRFGETRMVLATAAPDLPADGPMLAAIDLTGVDEQALIEVTRRIFRHRPSRSALKPAAGTIVAMPGMGGGMAVPGTEAHVAATALRRGGKSVALTFRPS